MIDWLEILNTLDTVKEGKEIRALYADIQQKLCNQNIGMIQIKIDWPYKQILQEIEQVDEKHWEKQGGKYCLPIYANVKDPFNGKSQRLWEETYKEKTTFEFYKPILDKVPTLVDWLTTDPMYKSVSRTSVMRLDNYGYIPEHKDTASQPFYNWLYMLQNSNAQLFVDGTEQMTLHDGAVYSLNDALLHSVRNAKLPRYNILRGGSLNNRMFINELGEYENNRNRR